VLVAVSPPALRLAVERRHANYRMILCTYGRTGDGLVECRSDRAGNQRARASMEPEEQQQQLPPGTEAVACEICPKTSLCEGTHWLHWVMASLFLRCPSPVSPLGLDAVLAKAHLPLFGIAALSGPAPRPTLRLLSIWTRQSREPSAFRPLFKEAPIRR
jgi:hypothetical protein